MPKTKQFRSIILQECLLKFVWPQIHLAILLAYLSELPNAYSGEQHPAFKVKGQISYEAFLANGTNLYWTRDFNVVVQDCRWIIESFDKSKKQYQINVRTNELMYNAIAVNPSNSLSLNNFTVVVEDNEVPPEDISGISILWLTYASDCYLNSVTNNKYKPVWMLDDPALRKEGFTTSGILDRMEGHLPKQLAYLNTGAIYARAQGNRVVIRAPASFRGAVTNAIYRTLETTKIGGFLIPNSFQYERYGVSPTFATHLLTRVTGKATLVEAFSKDDEAAPDLKGRMFFIDKRFENSKTNIDLFTYRTTNTAFPSSTDQLILDERKMALKNQAVINRSKKTEYSIPTKQRQILFLLATVSILPFAWIIFLKLKKKQKIK